MELTVLGSSGGYAGAGRACSGYLLQEGENSLLLDIGPGVLSNMLKYVNADRLGGLAITHLHYDHYMDIYGLATARRFWTVELPPLDVLVPPGSAERIAVHVSERSRPEFLRCFDFREYDDRDFYIAGFDLEAGLAEHVEHSYALRVTSGGRSVCYSGDTDRCDSLVELARGADLFVCEATFTSEILQKSPGHLFAAEAGEIASLAGVGRLVLTHVWPTLDGSMALEDAQREYEGPIELAAEGLMFEV